MKRKGIGCFLLLAAVVAGLAIWWGISDSPRKAERSDEDDKVPPAVSTPAPRTEDPGSDTPAPPAVGSIQREPRVRQVFEPRPWKPDAEDPGRLKDLKSLASANVLSPKGRYKAFMSPVEFEQIADVYVEDTVGGSQWRLQLDLDQPLTPTRLAWLDEQRLLVVVAYAYGTTSLGGDVYLVDAASGRGSLWYKPAERCQVTEVAVRGDKVELTVARFDENYDKHTTQTVMLDRP